ncbi:MAG: XRE family transcriptional regulator [Blastomonas sp. CACIA14H2]|uniref:helix-turn-helix domain-containing protein n=1 Tax=Blastomonas sp. CACIA14H2 TaxID=1419876 RepID=UPI0003D02DDF|nr:MAG: XRE family transcriptional regulator [Blastomonas sp. CACIA14H2]
MFSGQRLSLARRRMGLTKKGLADALGLHPRTVTRWEEDEREPSSDEVAMISWELQFPPAFFEGGEVDEAEKEAASFRSLSSMPARDRDAALAAGSFGFMFGDWVEKRFNLPALDLEDLSGETPDGAARALREIWGIGERPISHMINLLEAKGVRVFSLAEDTDAVDAFSMWRRDKAYVFLNCNKTAEHQRFDAAHELGHLVLHKHGGPRGREAEDEANRFAASFLMPRADVLAHLSYVDSLDRLIAHKRRWKVSLAALNHRVHKLNLTTEWEYRTFCIQIQQRGYRKAEPHGIERETSAVWQQVLAELRTDKVTKASIAEELGLPTREIENLVFGLANMLSVDGGGAGDGVKKGRLRLVA